MAYFRSTLSRVLSFQIKTAANSFGTERPFVIVFPQSTLAHGQLLGAKSLAKVQPRLPLIHFLLGDDPLDSDLERRTVELHFLILSQAKGVDSESRDMVEMR